MSPNGFICLHRGELTEELLRDHSAFVLLTLICGRARWRADVSPGGLRRGEARIGADDVNRRLGLSRKAYRCALDRLVAHGQITLVPVRGLGTVVRLGSKCVFSTEARKRADLGATKRADRFPSENASFGADLGADLGALKGPLRNTETPVRVQNPDPKGAGFESRDKRTQRERTQTVDSLSALKKWISEVQAMPEFITRKDIEEVAERCPPRNRAHLEHLVRIERHPRYRTQPRHQAGFDEPKGWREYMAHTYPGSRFVDPTNDGYAKSWTELPRDVQEKINREMTHAA